MTDDETNLRRRREDREIRKSSREFAALVVILLSALALTIYGAKLWQDYRDRQEMRQ